MINVLVAYATKHGSTKEVAEAIAGTLAGHVAVDFRPARSVREPVTGWDLVVLGAPIYSGRWHRDAHRFLKRHRKELPHVAVAVFAMGPRDSSGEAWLRSRAQLDRALARHEWLRPTATAVFGGADPPRRATESRRDLRDWDHIRAWAADLPRLLPAGAQSNADS